MSATNWQDPQTSEMRSTQISGLQEAVGKVETAIGMSTATETGIALSEVYISSLDRYRIYQAASGKRNWVASPAPVIYKNGIVIASGFTIDYGGGAIIANPSALSTDVFTADVTYINGACMSDIAATVDTHLADNVTDADGAHGLRIESGTWTPKLEGLTTAGANTYIAQTGYYYKIGKMVTCFFKVELSNKDAAMAGSVVIGGLPFTPLNAGYNKGSLIIGVQTYIDIPVGCNIIMANISPTSARFALLAGGDNNAPPNLTAANFANNSRIDGQISYITA